MLELFILNQLKWISVLIDFDEDEKPDQVSFMIKRIKVHTNDAMNEADYRYPGNYGVEKFLELFSGNNWNKNSTVKISGYEPRHKISFSKFVTALLQRKITTRSAWPTCSRIGTSRAAPSAWHGRATWRTRAASASATGWVSFFDTLFLNIVNCLATFSPRMLSKKF